jgi:hypothetical protein
MGICLDEFMLNESDNSSDIMMPIPIDSTVVTLTSPLFWANHYHRVKLLAGFNIQQIFSKNIRVNV